MQTSKLITIKRESKFIAISGDKKQYIIGFMNTRDAHCIKEQMNDSYNVYVKSSNTYNISSNIKKTMLELNLPIYNISDTIIVDNEAMILFPKNENKNTNYNYSLYNISYDNFVQIPLKNNLGLMIPYKMINENKEGYIFNACLISTYLKNNTNNIIDI